MNAMTLAPLSVATADTALAAYEIALTTRTPAAFETAAHALAAALRRDHALSRSGSRPRPRPLPRPAEPHRGRHAPAGLTLNPPGGVIRPSGSLTANPPRSLARP